MSRSKDSHKPTLLLVYNFNRNDFLSYFHACKDDFNFFFAEFVSPQEVYNQSYKEFGQAIYWGDYRDAYDLLEKVKPSKVLFLYLESYFHLALNIACKSKGIHTYLLDHGIQDSHVHEVLTCFSKIPQQKSKYDLYISKLRQAPARIKAKLFLRRTVSVLPLPAAEALKTFYVLRKNMSHLTIIKDFSSAYYQVDAYLAISPVIAKGHLKLLNYTPRKLQYFGVPTYDHLSKLYKEKPERKQLILIDQGLDTAGFLGWKTETFQQFIQQFTSICSSYGYRVYVKKHPRQPASDWANLQQQAISITDDELYTLLPDTSLIVGFFSTYLLPLVAQQHTTLLTLENHPAGKLDVSKSFLDAGVAHPIYNMQELEWALQHIEELHQKQLPNKAKFTEDWLYKFDGKSGERLRDLLLQEDL